MNAGIRNPRLNFWIAVALFVLGSGAIAWGALDMALAGAESAGSAIKIGGGILPALIGLLMSFNFRWAVRLVAAMRRGENVIARWTVPPGQFDEFRASEAVLASQGRRNDYRIPRATPAGGVEVIFSEDAVLIGDTFFGLARSGIARIHGVGMLAGNPIRLAFGTVLTTGRTGASGTWLSTITGELRVPVARTANDGARAVLTHYRAVIERRKHVKPEFWTRRIRAGLIAAAVAGAVCAGGFALQALRVDLGVAPLVMAVVGAISAIGGLVLALLAWRFRSGR